MGNLKFARDLFLESEEMNRFRRFIFDEGIRLDFKNNAERLGIVYNEKYDPNFNYFKPEPIGLVDQFKISPGFAYNKDGNVLTSFGANFTIPQRDTYFWLKVKYKFSSVEIGTVSIGGANGGLLNGIGTKFTEVLRGQPNFPAKIRLTNSNNYTLEYEVNQVVSDTVAYLQGSFPNQETGLTYAIVGTFSPGVYPPDADKFPFQYDDFDYTLVPELTLNVPPTLLDDYEFYVARVISNSVSGVEVQDKRRNYLYKTRSERIYDTIPLTNNPLIAIEAVGKKIIRSRIFYVARVGISFNITSETRNNNTNKIVVTGGAGGRYNSPSAMTTGDFDGWWYYYADGDRSRIISSAKVGTTIELIVDCLKQDVIGSMICPPAEEVELKVQYYNEDKASFFHFQRLHFYPYSKNVPEILIPEDLIADNVSEIYISYRYKTVFRIGVDSLFNMNTYPIENVGNATGTSIKIIADAGGPTQTAWRGIDVFCETETITPDIYYTIEYRNPTSSTDWNPDSIAPSTSTVHSKHDLYAKFYSDSGLTTPYTFTKNGLNVIVLFNAHRTHNNYDSSGTLISTYDQTYQYLQVISVNVVAANEVFLKNIDTVLTERFHPASDPAVFVVTLLEDTTVFAFPTTKIFSGRTGNKGFANLEQYFVNSGLATGIVKANTNTDPDYIAPSYDIIGCPLIVPNWALQYDYSLNVKNVIMTAGSGTENGLAIANTQNGGYVYINKQFNQDEDVTIQVRAQALAPSNTTGMIWVRVTWRNTGSTSDTISQYQIPSDVLTTLPITFKNLRTVNISNF